MNHSTNHNMAKEGCSAGFGGNLKEPQVLEQHKEKLLYSLNEYVISLLTTGTY